MPSNNPALKEFPIEFKQPSDPVMQPLFGQAGLATEGLTASVRAHVRELKSELAWNGGLFAMRPPVYSVRKTPYFHYGYTAAALERAPRLASYEHSGKWKPEINAHLAEFAAQSAAKEIIGRGLAAHYSRIAGMVERVPALSNDLLISGSRRADGIAPILAFGTIPGSAAVKETDFYKDWYNHRRVYVRLEAVAEKVGWLIPDFDNAGTRDAIRAAFTEVRNPELLVDPEELFMLSRLVVGRDTTNVGVEELYRE